VQQAQPPISGNSDPAVISKDGCTIDLKKICQAFINQPEFPLNGARTSWQRFVDNARPHEDVVLPAVALSPELPGSVECHIATHSRSATGAELLNGPIQDWNPK